MYQLTKSKNVKTNIEIKYFSSCNQFNSINFCPPLAKVTHVNNMPYVISCMKLLSVCHFVHTLGSQLQLNKEKIYNLFIPHKKNIIKVKFFLIYILFFFLKKKKFTKFCLDLHFMIRFRSSRT